MPDMVFSRSSVLPLSCHLYLLDESPPAWPSLSSHLPFWPLSCSLRLALTCGRGVMMALAVAASRVRVFLALDGIFDGGFRRDDGFERFLHVGGATGVFWEACVGVASYRVAARR